jgi:hypothetical protein
MSKHRKRQATHTLIILPVGILFSVIFGVFNPASGACAILLTLGAWKLDLRILEITRG